MILRIDGDVNRYYAQTLCMIFFPGATFGEDETQAEGVAEVHISTYKDPETGKDMAYASIRLNDKFCEATEHIIYNEEITIATHASLLIIL